MQDLEWNALSWLLAIARNGSLAGAARELGVSHATMFRRLNAVEKQLGVALFERTARGYVATAAGQRVTETAEQVERAANALARDLADSEDRPAGRVHLTTTDTLFAGVVADMLGHCRQRYPGIRLDVRLSNTPFDLARRQVDVAIRPMHEPPEALIAQKLGTVALAPYTSRQPAGEQSWVGIDHSVYFPALRHWFGQQGIDDEVYRVDGLLAAQQAVKSGAGRAVLPCYLADTDALLTRLGRPIDELAMQLWLLIHPDMRRAPRIRSVRDHLIGAFDRPDIQQRLHG